MTKLRTHVKGTRPGPATPHWAFFRKASPLQAPCGPHWDDIVQPATSGLLDYEVEIGWSRPQHAGRPTKITDANRPDYGMRAVVNNEVSRAMCN